MSQYHLVIVAPNWTPMLEQLILTTQDYYEVSVLTKKTESLSFSCEKVEVLQCFEELSPWEVVKLSPWLLQKTPALYHFILSEEHNTKELVALSTLASLIRGLPRNNFSYSLNCYLDSWSRFLLKPLLENQSPVNIWSHTPALTATRQLSSESNQLIPAKPQHNNYWYFPYSIATWSNQQNVILKTLLQLHPNLQIAITDWGNHPLRKRHIWRSDFQKDLNRIHLPYHVNIDSLAQNVKVVLLAGGSFLPWNESELIHLAQNRIPIILDEDQVQSLEAPWKHGDQVWILRKNQIREGILEFISLKKQSLTYASLQDLSYFQDHRSNQLLRALSEKFNLIE